MRHLFIVLSLTILTGCAGMPPITDVAMGGLAGYALFGDDIDQIQKEDLERIRQENIAKTMANATPPQAKSTAHRVANKVRDNVRATATHMKKWWFYDPAQVQADRETPSSYCYRARGDILCYSQPMQGWEGRLIGYQGTNAMLPAKTTMELPPKSDIALATTPKNRAANVKPVFSSIPVTEKLPENANPNEVMEESAHEPIADPTLSPQL